MWVAASAALFVLWAGSELGRTDGLTGTLARIAEWKIWSRNSIEWLRKILWLLFLVPLTLTVIGFIPFVWRHQRFIVTVLVLSAAIRYWPETKDFLKTIRNPSAVLVGPNWASHSRFVWQPCFAVGLDFRRYGVRCASLHSLLSLERGGRQCCTGSAAPSRCGTRHVIVDRMGTGLGGTQRGSLYTFSTALG
jgi:hypothetical protein